ncbi:MAG: Tim44 domain-containing protein [Burkholderiales bacterium]|nr:Tim44 domain-containing protein [Burkholderiales bacterium]
MKLKKVLAVLLLAATAVSLVAEARPMGGGRSIGRQSQSVSRMPAQPAPSPTAPRQAAPAPAPAVPPAALPPKPASPWKGILGGALLGLGLGALFSHFGMGGGFLGTILMAMLAFWLISMLLRALRGKAAPAASTVGAAPSAFTGNGGNVYPMPVQPAAAQPQTAAAPAAHQPWGVPADFDTAGFLRVAKSNFIRLQAAWDKADVADIREFTTPEVFAELKMQITERGAQTEYTDVVSLEAELLGIETGESDYLASVKFYGAMKPAPDALAEPFQEVWNLSKPKSGATGWMLAGIQQLA